jgi:osmotically-inducible protein OsmY
MNKHSRIVSWIAAGAMAATAATQLTGCALAVIGGAAGASALILTAGRRSNETATADGRIESQAGAAIEQALGERDHHVTVSSYYRKVLLTGEVANEADHAQAQALAQGVQEVQGVVNDLAVMPPSSSFSRSQDAYITSKVKTRFMHTNGLPAASIKVLTERGTVYLMGRLTRLEVQLATDAVQQVGGVQRVARVIDFISDAGVTEGPTSTVTGSGYPDVTANDGSVNDVTAPAPPGAAPPATQTRPVTRPAIEQTR